METIKDFVIDVLKDKLDEYEDTYQYGSELVYDLLQQYNVDGSYTYNTCEAKQWVQEYFDELGEIVNEMTEEGLPPCNVFEDPEAFQVQIMLFVASDLLAMCETVEEVWNDEIILDKDIIDRIKKELDNL